MEVSRSLEEEPAKLRVFSDRKWLHLPYFATSAFLFHGSSFVYYLAPYYILHAELNLLESNVFYPIFANCTHDVRSRF